MASAAVTETRTTARILIVGFGNSLRGDDGLGPYVVQQLALRGPESICIRVLLQLTPELAQDVARAELAIFVDADMSPAEGVSIRAAKESAVPAGLTHVAGVEALLGLAKLAYGKAPVAWIVSVAGYDFSFREGLSSLAQENARQATAKIEELIRESGASRRLPKVDA